MRHSLDVPGVSHGAMPIPAAVRMGPLLVTGSIFGRRHRDRSAPTSVDEQVRVLFDNIQLTVASGGLSTDAVIRVNVAARELATFEVVDLHWVRMFPNAESRPSRLDSVERLPAWALVRADVIAFQGASDP